jgi:hypothetical protein
MKKLTDDQWSSYEKKYGSLMRMISLKISGSDNAIANPEDNYSDLCIAALESIEGFRKKTGEEFEEAMQNKLFDQYTKTVLWNRKAKKGIPLSKKMEFRKSHRSLDYTNTEDSRTLGSSLPDMRSSLDASSVEFQLFLEDQPKEVKDTIDVIVKNPNLVSKQGFIRKSELGRILNKDYTQVNKVINRLQKLMNDYSDRKGAAND